MALFALIAAWGFAGDGGLDVWVICQPGHGANVYEEPSCASKSVCRYNVADRIRIDGTYQNGFAHCDHGWISLTCIVTDEPEWENGSWYTVTECTAAWSGFEGRSPGLIRKGTRVQVLWRSDEYCVTNRGIIRTKDLEDAICRT